MNFRLSYRSKRQTTVTGDCYFISFLKVIKSKLKMGFVLGMIGLFVILRVFLCHCKNLSSFACEPMGFSPADLISYSCLGNYLTFPPVREFVKSVLNKLNNTHQPCHKVSQSVAPDIILFSPLHRVKKTSLVVQGARVNGSRCQGKHSPSFLSLITFRYTHFSRIAAGHCCWSRNSFPRYRHEHVSSQRSSAGKGMERSGKDKEKNKKKEQSDQSNKTKNKSKKNNNNKKQKKNSNNNKKTAKTRAKTMKRQGGRRIMQFKMMSLLP